jgi:hypothetical protein
LDATFKTVFIFCGSLSLICRASLWMPSSANTAEPSISRAEAATASLENIPIVSSS